METIHKTLLLYTKVQQLARGKQLVWVFKLQTELHTFFKGFHIVLKKHRQSMVIRIWVLVDIITSHSSHFKEKNKVFVANYKL